MYKHQEEHSFKLFTKNIRANEITDIILMYGVEQYLVSWAVETLVKKYVNPACLYMDYVVFDDEKLDIESIINSCDTFSMISEKRVVWVKNFKPLESETPRGYKKEDIDRLINYIENNNPSTILVLSCMAPSKKLPIYKSIAKAGQVYNFDQIDKQQLVSFAKKRFQKAGVEIEPKLLRMMIDLTGYYNKDTEYRLYNFENDIKKVIAHSDGQFISEEDINYTVNGDLDTYIFNLMDAISSNKKDNAFKLLYNILDAGSDVYSIISLIVSQFELILEVKELRQDGKSMLDISKELKIHEFRVKKAIGFGDKFTIEKIKEILSGIYEVDRSIKTGLLEQRLALELFIARI